MLRIPMRLLLVPALLAALSAPAFAVSVEIEKLDSSSNYGAFTDTAAVRYYKKCTWENLRPYDWKIWEGHYAIRSYIEAVATITVEREPEEPFLPNADPFIRKAVIASAKAGGNVVCYVSLKESMGKLGFEKVTFRAYRQMFISGHSGWVDFFQNEIAKRPIDEIAARELMGQPYQPKK